MVALTAASAVAVAMRTGLPIMQPSPRKSPGPRMASTASLPWGFTMVSLALPDWMYQTSLHGSSCEKSACPFLYLIMRLEAPALERDCSTLKPRPFFVFRALLATGMGSLPPIVSRLVSKVNSTQVRQMMEGCRGLPAGYAVAQ